MVSAPPKRYYLTFSNLPTYKFIQVRASFLINIINTGISSNQCGSKSKQSKSKQRKSAEAAHGGERGEVALESETQGADAGALALEARDQRPCARHVPTRERHVAAVQRETPRRLPTDAAAPNKLILDT